MIEKAANRSRELFESGLYCAESVLLSITEAKGIESPLIPRIATGFCSGISRSFNLCGAVSGAIMAISIFMGRDTPEESVEPCYSSMILCRLYEGRCLKNSGFRESVCSTVLCVESCSDAVSSVRFTMIPLIVSASFLANSMRSEINA